MVRSGFGTFWEMDKPVSGFVHNSTRGGTVVADSKLYLVLLFECFQCKWTQTTLPTMFDLNLVQGTVYLMFVQI